MQRFVFVHTCMYVCMYVCVCVCVCAFCVCVRVRSNLFCSICLSSPISPCQDLVTEQTRMKYERVCDQIACMTKIMSSILRIADNMEYRSRQFCDDMRAFHKGLEYDSQEMLSLFLSPSSSPLLPRSLPLSFPLPLPFPFSLPLLLPSIPLSSFSPVPSALNPCWTHHGQLVVMIRGLGYNRTVVD